MKSFCMSGLILFVSLGWAASANAQYGGAYNAPSLLPLPSALPTLPVTQTVGYYDNAPPEPYGDVPEAKTADPAPPIVAPAPKNDFQLPPSMSSEPVGCGECGTCNSCCGPRWFGYAGGLIMGRNRANPFWTTYETNNNANQLLNTQNAKADWAGGGQITVGAFNCCGTGLAFTYWGLGQMNGFASIISPTNELSTPINLQTQTGDVLIGANTASSYFDNAREHRIWRADNIQNFEVNALQMAWVNSPNFQLMGLAGFRYFRFDESLTFGSAQTTFGANGGADEAYLSNRVINNLFGGQVGALGNFVLTERLGWYILPKAGIFANQMNGVTRLYSGDGLTGSADGVNFPIYAHKSDVAFLSEIDTGFTWAITPGIRALIGYRVIGVANVALADNQFLPFLADTAAFGSIKQDGALIIHGATAGVVWTF